MEVSFYDVEPKVSLQDMKFESYDTVCSYCGVGCGMKVKKHLNGTITTEGNPDYPVNKGMLCSKGMNLDYVLSDTSDRLLQPQMRWSRSHPLQDVTWDQALERMAVIFRSAINKFGADKIGIYVSGQCLTEEYYLINKLAKGFLQTNNIDTNSRLCMSSAVVAYKNTFGEDSVPVSYADIEYADTFLIAGANPAWCHPILFRRLEEQKEKNPDIKIIVVDPRRTQSCSIADLHLQINPGTDIILYHAIARKIYENNQYDKSFIEEHTEDFLKFKKAFANLSIRKAAKICGIDVHDIRKAAKYLGDANRFLSMWAMGLNQSTIGVGKNYALLNLHLLTGQIGKKGSGPLSLTGQPNAMGGREVGGMANLLAVHKSLDNPDHRRQVADFWGVDAIQAAPGYTATKMFEALASGSLRVIWIICTNPAVSLPHLDIVEKGLKNAKFVIVQDISNRSDTVKYADLILPAAGWAEKEGVMTNSERRISYLPKIVDPPGEAIPDVEIIWKFAQKMGYVGFDYNNVGEVYDEYCRLTKDTNIDISGLSHDRLIKEGSFQWPVPYADHPGTPRLFVDHKFYTASQKAKFNIGGVDLGSYEKTNKEYPLILTTGRVRDQWHTMTKTGKVNKLLTHIYEPFLEMHPVDALVRDLTNNQIAMIKSTQGEIKLKVKISLNIKEGTVFVPMHWGKLLQKPGGRVNILTSNEVDPYSRQPGYKFTAVEVIKYRKPVEKVCVIGAGAAAFRFVSRYRELNTKDEIHIFSQEEYPFYNRVLLPEYVSEKLTWDQLQKIKRDELEKLDLQLYKSNPIVKIKKANREIVDSHGEMHTYDKLVLCMGSRPFLPREVPIHMNGIFTMRHKYDADELKSYLSKSELNTYQNHVVIIGGGLLGLEVAAALREMNIKITIVQRADRLMERQLDEVSSKLLAEDVMERGIQIYFNNEVSTIFADDTPCSLTITLNTGKVLQCNAVVYAIGTRMNIEIAKECGLDCNRGVVVDEYLKTSDPSISAIGEIAEFRQNVYGITAAAEQQANIVAQNMNGDDYSYYSGSVPMNILKFENLDLCSIGKVKVPPDDPRYEEILFLDYHQRYYKKCIIKDDRLVGAILMGDKDDFAEFRNLIENKLELSDKRERIFRSPSNRQPVMGKLICSCNHVGQVNIENEIKAGYTNFEELCKKTGAGLGCGSCKPEVKHILNSVMVLDPTTI